MNIGKPVLCLLVASMLGGCYGKKPPAPQSGGTGPVLFKPAFDLANHDFTSATPIVEVLAFYRHRLRASAHNLPPEMAQKFADIEIANLRARFQGRDDELRTEVLKRLGPPKPIPTAAIGVNKERAKYPEDPTE